MSHTDYYEPVFRHLADANVDKMDPGFVMAINDIYSKDNIKVSIDKARDYRLITGRNESTINTNYGSLIGAMVKDSDDALLTEITYPSTNAITHIMSSQDTDDEDVFIWGAYYDNESNLIWKEQTITLNGNTPVELDQHLSRAFEYINVDNSNVGRVTVFDGTASTTAGLVDAADAAKVYLTSDNLDTAYKQSSHYAHVAIPKNHYGIITEIEGGSERASNTNLTVYVQFSKNGGPFYNVVSLTGGSNGQNAKLSGYPYLYAPPNTDIRLMAYTTSSGSDVYAHIRLTLAKIQG